MNPKNNCITTLLAPVRNWGHLENWKSTAPTGGGRA